MARLSIGRRQWISLIVLVGLFSLVGSSVLAWTYPIRNDPYVNDYANVLSPETETSIKGMLTELKSRDDIEMSVITINSIQDYDTDDLTIESFATRLFNRWGLGNALTDKGVLMLVAVKDRKVRIELGDGYGTAYDSKAMGVINEFILPAFRNNDYTRGIDRGVKGTIHTVTGNWPTAGSLTIVDDPKFPYIVGGAGILGLGVVGWGLYSFFKHRCPQCGKHNLYIASNTLRYATYDDYGEKEIVRDCQNCGFHDTQMVSLSPISRPSSSDSNSYRSRSSSGGGGSSSSGGGGHSSGGGATGSW